MRAARGRRVAVDLSVWVVSSLRVRVPARRPHLRTTFFRTLSLFAAMGASPVFVIDGPPSPLKSRFFRSAAAASSSSSSSSSSPPAPAPHANNGRNAAFSKYISECVELLRHLGMPVLCAQLNRDGHVHACITADSDAFLFGPPTVIRALRPNSKAPFECYHMADIESLLGLKRNKLCAFRLHEIGRGKYPGGPRLFLSKPPHTRNGDWQANNNNVCKRLAAETNFPNDDIYLCSDHNLDAENGTVPALRWDEPNVDAVVDFLGYTQNWAPSYVRRHMLPMLSTIYLRRLAAASPPPPCQKLLLCDRYEFHSIQRIKVRHGRPCYLVRWMKRSPLVPGGGVLVFGKKHLKNNIDDANKVAVSDEAPQLVGDDSDDDDNQMFVTTEEDIQLVTAAFPDEARRFQEQERRLREEKSRPPRKKHVHWNN